MNDLTSTFSNFSNIGEAVNITNMIISLVLSFILSVITAKIYQATYKGGSFSPAFMQTLVICCIVITAIMIVIGSNVARAFSLVGALSIIRFRNAVKDPRDVAYIFLAMGIGMACGCGSKFWLIAVILTIVAGLAALFLSAIKFGEHSSIEKILKIQAPKVSGFETIFNDLLSQFTEQFNLISAESTRMGTELELTFIIKVKKNFSSEELINELSKLNDNLKVQIIGSNHVLDL